MVKNQSPSTLSLPHTLRAQEANEHSDAEGALSWESKGTNTELVLLLFTWDLGKPLPFSGSLYRILGWQNLDLILGMGAPTSPISSPPIKRRARTRTV